MRFWWLGAAAMIAAPATAADCAGLAGAVLAGAQVTAAAPVAAATPPFNTSKDFCRVTVTARPSADSDVRIELWIPPGAAWNGKFLQVGNGGFAGKIPYGSLGRGLAGGYAVAGTDNGHRATRDIDASWALGHPEKIVDFGWRAVKATTDVSKALLKAYGTPPTKAYFFGCSDGGREALMTAQRYPADFDGIVAGAAAHDWTALMASAGLVDKATLAPGRALPAAKLPALQAAALAACGKGKGWIADPQACRFDPGVIACTGAETDACLTPGQLATVRLVYRGTRNPATGRALYGLRPGAEAQPGGWGDWGVGDAGGDGQGFAHDYFGYMVRQQAEFRTSQLTTADLKASEQRLAPILNATSANLTAFRARGGKLIQYHGWNDPAISPSHSLAYAAALERRMGDIASFHRLYMVPGMLHCGRGASPTNVDWLALLDEWVDRGVAPGVVTARGADGATQALPPALSASAPRSAGRARSR